jgi:excinuclease ABC subunit C
LSYERAQYYKDKLQILERFQGKSLVVNRSLSNIDVMTITAKDNYAYVNYTQVNEGSIVYSKTIEIKKLLGEPENDLLAHAFLALRDPGSSRNAEVLSNVPIQLLPAGTRNIVPKIGDKKKLILLSLKNALEMQKERELLRAEKRSSKNKVITILQEDLRLAHAPLVIECFDNSNFQGSVPVASMVRFVNGKPDKKNYRHFNIKTVVGPNDFESMKEVVGRRYRKLRDEQSAMPDLILVDGGKGQLSSACEALKELDLYGKIPVAGIAKRLEEIYYPEDPVPLHINKKSQGLQLLQNIRDEAHRFAITFHRQKRSKTQIHSELEEVKGIGPKTFAKLLQRYKSVKKIKEAPFDELRKVIGEQRARLIAGGKQKAP